MKIPPVFAHARIFSIALIAALSFSAAAAHAETRPVAEMASERVALADAAELEALSNWHAKLDRSFDAKLATKFEGIAEQALNSSMGSLAGDHDGCAAAPTQSGERAHRCADPKPLPDAGERFPQPGS